MELVPPLVGYCFAIHVLKAELTVHTIELTLEHTVLADLLGSPGQTRELLMLEIHILLYCVPSDLKALHGHIK